LLTQSSLLLDGVSDSYRAVMLSRSNTVTARPKPWFVIGTLAAAAVLMVSPLYGAIPLTPRIASEYGVSASVAELVVFAFGFPYAIACLLFGPLSDVKGRRAILLGGMIAATIFSVLTTISPSFPFLLAARIGQGLAAGTFGPVALGFVAEAAFAGQLKQAGLAILSTGLIASGSIGQVTAQVISELAGWRLFFGTVGALEIGIVLAMLILLNDASPDRSKRSLWRTYAAEGALLKTGAIRASYLVGFVLFLSFVLYYVALGPYVARIFGGQTDAVFIIRAVTLPGMLLTVFAGPLIARFTARRIVAGGLALAALGLFVSFASSRNVGLLTAASAVYSLGFAFGAVALNTLMTELGGAVRGTAVAFSVFISFTGASLAPIVYNNIGSYGFRAVVAGLAIATIIAWIGLAIVVQRDEAVHLPETA
jgi:MFS transporter, YNFM family, putative membrane transport protein